MAAIDPSEQETQTVVEPSTESVDVPEIVPAVEQQG